MSLVTLTEPRGSVAEALRVLRSNLEWKSIDDGWRSLLVASSIKGEGKTLTLCNLAVTLALAGKKVVVVDADLRDPQVHKAFALPNETGLTTVIQGTLSLATALRTFDVAQADGSGLLTAPAAPVPPPAFENGALKVLTSGPLPPNPGEVIASRRLADDAEAPGPVRGRLRPGRRAAAARRRRRGRAAPPSSTVCSSWPTSRRRAERRSRRGARRSTPCPVASSGSSSSASAAIRRATPTTTAGGTASERVEALGVERQASRGWS